MPATPQDLALQRGAFRRLVPLGDADLAELPRPLRVQLPAGLPLLRAGERAHEAALVIDGGLREYYVLADGTERSKSFNLPGDFAGSLSDLLSGAASRTWVVAERPTTLLVTPWSAYAALVAVRPAWTRFAQAMAEQLYLAKAQREYELLALDAAQRYRATLARWPQIESLFTQKDIASYIGITPVHLSRLRARLRR